MRRDRARAALLRGAAIAALACLPPALAADDPGTHKVETLAFLGSAEALPGTKAEAALEGFPTRGIQIGDAAARPATGDSVVALVSLTSFDGRLAPRQWVVRLRLASPGERPGSASAPPEDVTYYTNVGDAFVFHSEVTAMGLESMGPLVAGAQVGVKRRQIAVCTDYLTLDLGRVSDVIYRIKRQEEAAPAAAPYTLSARQSPFPAGEWGSNRRAVAAFALTRAERRSFAGALPALFQFLDIVRSTPDLSEILMQVLDKPSIIDVLRSGARENLNLAFAGAGPVDWKIVFQGESGSEPLHVLAFNLEVFGKPALAVVLVAAQPRPPLEVSAGILGVVAFSPTNPGKCVVVRVVSAAQGAQRQAAP